MFIYTHYPTFSAPDQMVLKIYELYSIAHSIEEAKRAELNAYSKKPSKPKQDVEYVDEVVLLEDEDVSYGAGFGKNTKKTQKKRDE